MSNTETKFERSLTYYESVFLCKFHVKYHQHSQVTQVAEYLLSVAMPIQYELCRLFYLMNIQTHRNSTSKALILGAFV